MEYIFEYQDKVRDYECDLQGIVNNANYQHYTEHARHEFLLSHGISFAELHERGIDCVVSKVEIRYRIPLRSRDRYAVRIRMVKDGIKYVFFQDIYRLPDNTLCTKARVEAVCLINGKLGDTDILMNALCKD